MIRRRAGHGPIGLDIGTRDVAAVQLKLGPGEPTVLAAALIGRNAAASTAVLSQEEAGRIEAVLYRQGFQGPLVATGVPDDLLLSAILELPPRSSGAPLDQLARLELARTNKQEPEAIESGCWEIPAPARSTETSHMMAAGCTHEVADSVLNPLEGAGFRVSALDARSWALARAVSAGHRGHMTGISAVLDIGDGGALLTMLHGETPVYRRFMPDAGMEGLRNRVMQKLRLDAETTRYAVQALLDSKANEPGDSGPGVDKEALTLFDEHVGMMRAEMAGAAEYVGHRYPPGLQRAFVCGSIGEATGLIRSLETQLGVSITRGHAGLVAASSTTLAGVANDPRLFAAVGLALTGQRSAA